MLLPSFSFAERAKAVAKMAEDTYDLLVIGGGVNGAGVAREATLRGMRVALIEKNDYASGTSSRSSKLIHGGIRYLENGDFGLVFEALSERAELFRMAPHLVHPLQFLIPVFKTSRVPSWKLAAGMWLYDVLASFETPYFHESLSPAELQIEYPHLRSEGLVRGFRYADAYTDDDRLVLESLRSANNTGLLHAANYVEWLAAARGTGGDPWLVTAYDRQGERKLQIRARHIVVTAGPWTDEIRYRLLGGSTQARLRPSKGVHLTFTKEDFPLSTAVVMGVEERIVFAIPRAEMVIVGTTDTDFSGDPGEVSVTPEDVSYLLGVTKEYFPFLSLSHSHVVGAYAGVRPLIAESGKDVGKTSREHLIWSEEGMTWMAGGKYTTYRLMAEQAVDFALKAFPIADQVRWGQSRSRAELNPLVTQDTLLKSSEFTEELLAQYPELSPEELQILVSRYGAEVTLFSRYFGRGWSYAQLEAHYAIRFTQCLSLKDFYFRRVPWLLSRKDHGFPWLDELFQVWKLYGLCASESDWEDQKRELITEWKKVASLFV
jgi:glycerol-3-phosphate dehydrogenase